MENGGSGDEDEMVVFCLMNLIGNLQMSALD